MLDKLAEKQARHDEAEEIKKKKIAANQSMGKVAKPQGVFITGTDPSKLEDDIEFANGDVIRHAQWKAHADAINWVTWAADLKVAASCSFDCNVYMWFRDN